MAKNPEIQALDIIGLAKKLIEKHGAETAMTTIMAKHADSVTKLCEHLQAKHMAACEKDEALQELVIGLQLTNLTAMAVHAQMADIDLSEEPEGSRPN